MTAVDRTVPLITAEFGKRNPGRVHVIRGITLSLAQPWQVWRGIDPLHAADTHAEAIWWAQARAAIDKHPNATRYRLNTPASSRKQAQEPRTGPPSTPNHPHTIPGPQNRSNDLDAKEAP